MGLRARVLAGVIALYLVSVGFLAGVATERGRANGERTKVLARYDEALRQWQSYRMGLERVTAAATAEGRRAGEMTLPMSTTVSQPAGPAEP
jgi:hypothetical protein